MEVSEGESKATYEPLAELGGQELIQTVLSLTGLPEPWVRIELDEILESSGQNCENLTLKQLRQALVAHLESLQADFMGESLDNSE